MNTFHADAASSTSRMRGVSVLITRARTHLAAFTWSPWMLVPVMVWVVTGVAGSVPLQESDSFWHVLMGRDIVNEHRFTGDPAWVFGPHGDWVTTQWLTEVVFAGLHALFGWAGLTYFTLVCAVGVLVALARVLRAASGGPLTSHPVTWVVYAVVGWAVAVDLQTRPAALSWVFLMVLAGWAWCALNTGEWPAFWVMTSFTWVWAQFHGYWVMVAAVITLVALLRAVEMRNTTGWVRPFVLAAGTSLVGVLTPAGAFGLYAPVAFKAAAGPYISEWAPTNLTGDHAVPLLVALVSLVGAAWARSPRPVPVREIGWVLFWVVFAITAFRNVVPAMLLIAPVAAMAVTRAWPTFGTHMKVSGLTRLVLAVVTVFGLVLITSRLVTGPALATHVPQRLYDLISAEPGTRRVLNFYDVGGQTLALTRPGVQVVVDGRSDMYGPENLKPYFNMLDLRPGWKDTFVVYAPTDVLMPSRVPLDAMLPGLGWHRVAREGGFTLWRR